MSETAHHNEQSTTTSADSDDGEEGLDRYSKRPVVLSVNHVGKSFKLPTEQATGLKQLFINWAKGIRGYRNQVVLKDINFQVHQGEFFGIVGRNGGGKSTLLKIISQIYYPNKGSVSVKGKLVPFIELGVGFNPELTGRENVYLNGNLLGFSNKQIDAMYDDIVDFAELQDFMDQKLKNYSSGMQVRLAFSVAIKAHADILVLDEVLAVGDEAFQRKCDNYFSEVKKDPTKTVILVTHDMGAVKRYCTRAMLITDGDISIIGDPESVADAYTLENLRVEQKKQEDRAKQIEQSNAAGKPQKTYPEGLNAKCPLLRTFPISSPVMTSKDTFTFGVEYQYDEPGDFYLAISLNDIRRGGISYDTGSKVFKMKKHGHHTVRFQVPLHLFNSGDFKLFTSLRVPSKTDPNVTDMVAVATGQNACTFMIRNKSNDDHSYALLNHTQMRISPAQGETGIEEVSTW
jgi:ABC-2 type transport system ATP-binding protein